MEKFCLKWNEFQQNISSTFNYLRKNEQLFDVTLVADDGKHFSSHKLVLASSSDFFQDIVHNSKSKQHDFFIYLAGVRSEELEYILDYIYNGEVQLYQEHMNSFLDIAQKLKIKGLLGSDDDETKSKIMEEKVSHVDRANQHQFVKTAQNEDYTESNEKCIIKNDGSSVVKERDECNPIANQSGVNVKEIVGDMICQMGEKWVCKKCGKEAKRKDSIKLHAEIHIDGLIFNCDKCGMAFRSRNALATHKSRSH